MENIIVFEEKDLERIGVVCPICQTESIFDLSKDQTANADKSCPGCGQTEFLSAFRVEAAQRYNWITYYKRVRDLQKNVKLRFYTKAEND